MEEEFDTSKTIYDMLAEKFSGKEDLEIFARQVAKFKWQSLTWTEFCNDLHRVAASMLEYGIKKGDYVVILAPCCYEWEVISYALHRIGCISIGIEPHVAQNKYAELKRIITPNFLITTSLNEISSIEKNLLKHTKTILLSLYKKEKPSSNTELQTKLNIEEIIPLKRESLNLKDPPQANDLAAFILTSGTTGKPKGICYTQGQIAATAVLISETFSDIKPGSNVICWLPLANLYQKALNIAALRSQCKTYFLSDPKDILEACPIMNPTVFVSVPRFFEKVRNTFIAKLGNKNSILRRLLEITIRVETSDYKQLKVNSLQRLISRIFKLLVFNRLKKQFGNNLQYVISGSSSLSTELWYFFNACGINILEAYGISENVIPNAMNTPWDYKPGSVGKPLFRDSLKITESGLIAVKGPGICEEYFSEHYENKAEMRKTADNFFITGDMGYIDKEGYIYITGRETDLIKTSSGRRIAPIAVEEKINSADCVDQSVVIGNNRKCLVAIVSSDLSNGHSLESIIEELSSSVEELSFYESPAGYILLDRDFSMHKGELTANLKLRRRAVEDAFSKHIDKIYEEIEKAQDNENAAVALIKDDKLEFVNILSKAK